MKFTLLGLALAALVAGGAHAQTTETKSETKLKVKEGKTVTVTGCLRANAARDGYILTDVSEDRAMLHSYQLVGSAGKDLEEYVGHWVEVTGKAVDKGKGKIETETKTRTKVTGGETKRTESESQIEGDLRGLPFLGVKSVKTIANTCR